MKGWEKDKALGPMLPFDCVERERRELGEALERGRKDAPKNDSERMTSALWRYRRGDNEALGDFYLAAMHAGKNFARKLRDGSARLKRRPWREIEGDVHDAVTDVAALIANDKTFAFKRSASGYIYLRVRTKLFPYQKKAERGAVPLESCEFMADMTQASNLV